MRQLKIMPSATNRDERSVCGYLSDLNRLSDLTINEEIELAQTIHQGGEEAEKAKVKLIKGNLKFVVSVAKQYLGMGLPLADLINEGNIGLIKCVSRFDETRGFKFISYAIWWIRQSIIEAISSHGRMIRLPLNNVSLLNKYWKLHDLYIQDCQRPPTAEEFAEAVGIDTKKATDIIKSIAKTSSIDDTLGDDSDTKTSDTLISDYATDEETDKESMKTDVLDVMRRVLQSREMEVLCCTFGISTRRLNADELSLRFDLSQERLRQIREIAIKKLRCCKDVGVLRMYL